MIRVVNIKRQAADIYIGRGSRWGNPFKIGVHGDRNAVIEQYAQYLESNLELVDELRAQVNAVLAEGAIDCTLGCFCAPAPCHGDVLIDYLYR